MAQQQQEMNAQKAEIQQAIKDKQAELQDLQQQLSNVGKA
jgi:hypothetical protein